MTDPSFCLNCGAPWPPGARFCTSCGADQIGAGGAEPEAQPSAFAPSAPTPQPWLGHCDLCGGDGRDLSLELDFCPSCRWVRPLSADYTLTADAFLWRYDAEAMSRIQSITPLRSLAETVSEKYARPLFEAAADGVRVGPTQLGDIFSLALRAARALALPRMPVVVVSGHNMWDAKAYAGESSALVVLGSILANYRGPEMLFVIARQLGHVAAGHGLWTSTLEFALGQAKTRATIMGEGVAQFLNPMKVMESAIEAPLLAWSRHSQITADRAGLLAVGDFEVARRVLTQMSLKSFPLFDRIDADAWRQQEEESDLGAFRFAERTMTDTPYLATRLKLLREFHESDDFKALRADIEALQPPLPPTPTRGAKKKQSDTITTTCASCSKKIRIARKDVEGKAAVRITCPNPECGAELVLRPKPAAAAQPPRPDMTGD